MPEEAMTMPARAAVPKARPDFAADYAAFSANLSVDGMPPEVIEAVKTDLFDTLACASAGISAAGVPDLAELVTGWGGKPEAAIWCTGARVPAHHAAWVNGMMSHARDFDDTHDAAVLHAGVSVVPAAIAAAELNPAATGADLIAGVAAGLELICRLGVATKVGIIESGYMYTSLFGHFAATAAAARVLGFDEEQTVNALGIAYSQAAGTHQVTRDAALTKRVQPGFAAKSALVSVAMTRIGIRGARQVFEGVDGLFRSYLRDNVDRERLRDGLGERFEFLDLSFKPYPCCRFNHTAIDAALEIRRRMGAEAVAGITRATAYVNRQSYEAVGTPIEMRKKPETVVQAQFSIPYTVACALRNGGVQLTDFTDEGIRNADVRATAALVDVSVDADIERDWGRNVSPTRLVVETAGGNYEARFDKPRGNFAAPMSREDFDAKMAGCLAISGLDWPQGTIDRLHAAIDGLDGGISGQAMVEVMTSVR
jgi:2-methylcitrate dehydratase PrpD